MLGAKMKNPSYTDTIDNDTLSRMGYEYSNNRWVPKHMDEDEDEDEDVPPAPTQMEMKASTSAPLDSHQDIMSTLHDLKVHMDSRLDSIDTHLGSLDTRFDSLDSRMGSLDTHLGDMHTDLGEFRDYLDRNGREDTSILLVVYDYAYRDLFLAYMHSL